MPFYGRWRPYVPVAQRRSNAARESASLKRKGHQLRPVWVQSKTIANSFWGLAWCRNLENYADWSNRLPRGRSYARNGSILDLQINPGEITAMVSGSSIYRIRIAIKHLDAKKWKAIRQDCSQQVSSLLDLMRGKLPDAVLKRLTDPKEGIFPSPRELTLRCSCPDYATMCKHIAATLYGVGHLLDSEPALFFKMRGVDQAELVSDAITNQTSGDAIGLDGQSDLAGEDLGAIFGIELASGQTPSTQTGKRRGPKSPRRNSAAAKQTPQDPAPKKTAPPTSAKKSAVTKATAKRSALKKSTVKKTTLKKTTVKKSTPTPKRSAKATSDPPAPAKNSKPTATRRTLPAAVKKAIRKQSAAATTPTTAPTSRRKKTSETITAPLTKRQPKSKASAKATAKKAKR